jgi:hypothetical protein
MRRVVTGLGIVSSIGNTTQEVHRAGGQISVLVRAYESTAGSLREPTLRARLGHRRSIHVVGACA